MAQGPRRWQFWTRHKLQMLEQYLDRFSTAAKGRPERIYIDLFAGEGVGTAAETGEEFPGSARIACETDDPPFTRVRLCELGHKADRLAEDLAGRYPDRDIRVVRGDCNDTIGKVLADLAPYRWEPTFAFIDPQGLEVAWTTLEALAAHRPEERRVELWMLFNPDGVMRTLDLDRDHVPQAEADRATRLFGTDEWRYIWEARRRGELQPWQAREEYVNLMRWRLETLLGYRWTHPFELTNLHGNPMYTMIFATANDAGNQIMSWLYAQAQKDFPEMRDQIRQEARGTPRLFYTPAEPSETEPYEYTPPHRPPFLP